MDTDVSSPEGRPGGTPTAQPSAEQLEDALFDSLRQHMESMIAWGRGQEAQALEHDRLEERVLADGYEVMRLHTEAIMGVRTARETRRDDVADADGAPRVTVEDGKAHTRTMIYGPVRTSRMAYRRHHKPNLYPQDRDLNWAVVHSYSAGVVKRVAAAAALVPFEQTAAQVSAAGAIKLGKRQAEQLAVAATIDFEAFYADRRPPPRPDRVGLLITADGSAFPVLPTALRPATAKAAAARKAASDGWPEDPGQHRKSKKRSAELVCVADIPPTPRTPSDILDALFPTGHQRPHATHHGAVRARNGPVAEGKTLFASARHPIAQVVADGFAEAHRRDPEHRRDWFALVDGNNAQIDAVTAEAARHQVKVPILIDFIHVVQYLWKAAGSFFYPHDPEARAWVKTQADKILQGKARDVATGIRRRATRFGYGPKEREGADAAATYLDNKKDYLDYPAFLAAGRPIASGLIEGACRWLVKDRMEVTGARWSLDNAEAVLKLRALTGNGDFDDYFAYHLQQEKRRNHDSRYLPDPDSIHDHPPPSSPPLHTQN
jgi:hypothetical protein